jgi:predicted MFS family arabinose efflux permease
MFDGADILVMSFIAPVLSEEWAISPERLGILFSGSLAGMAIGCLCIAPTADQFGRRRVILSALAIVSVVMIASAFATNILFLGAARLAVGMGVGTIGVSMTALAAEYAPPRHTSSAVLLVQGGWPLAAVATAFAAVSIIENYSWRILLLIIGLVSVVLLILVVVLLPDTDVASTKRSASSDPTSPNTMAKRIGELFSADRARSSVLLWIAVTLCYFSLYFAISWIPRLAVVAGLSFNNAVYAGATFNLGAFVGTMLVGALAMRFRLDRVIAGALLLAAMAMAAFGNLHVGVAATLAMAFVVGVSVQGGFNGLWGLAANLYPARIRSTGIGWALGVGRIGAVLGPIVGGYLVGQKVSIDAIFAIYACPLIAAALCVALLGTRSPSPSEKDGAPSP